MSMSMSMNDIRNDFVKLAQNNNNNKMMVIPLPHKSILFLQYIEFFLLFRFYYKIWVAYSFFSCILFKSLFFTQWNIFRLTYTHTG